MRAWRVILPLAGRHLVRRKLVAGVAVLGLASGLASVMATQLLYASVVTSYEATTARFVGRAALLVANGDSGVADELADELRQVPGVRAVVASVEGFVPTPDFPGERLYLYGVDLLADQDVRDYGAGSEAVVSDPMAFLAAADSVALTKAFAGAYGLDFHDRIRVLTPTGIVELTVRAMLGKQDGAAAVLDGRLAVVDLSVAQELLRLERRVSQLAITVDEGADLDEVEHMLKARVGPRGAVARPKARTAAFAHLLRNYRNGLFLAATIAVVVALYFLFGMVTVAVAERRRELALLRSLGMRSHALMGLVVVELLVLSVVATGVGLPLGVGLARVLLRTFATGVATLYVDVGRPELQLDLHSVFTCALLGLSAPCLVAVGAVRRTLTIRPIDALRTSPLAGPSGRPSRRSYQLAVVVAAGGGCLWMARRHVPLTIDTVGMTVLLCGIAAIALAVPAGVRLLARLGDRLAAAVGRPLPLLASRNVRNELRRVVVTCAAVLVSLAGTIAVATWISSLDATLHTAFDTVFARIDLVVSGGADPFGATAVRMPSEVGEIIASWPGVDSVDAVRVDTIAFEGSRATIVAADTHADVERRRLYMVQGDAAAAAASLAAGTGVLVNQAFARRFGRRLGDVLELPTPEGSLRVRIAGMHLELTPGDLGTIRLDRTLYRRWWRDDTVNLVEVSLRSDADRRHVVDAIRARFERQHQLVVLTIEEMRRTYRQLLGRMTNLVYPLLAVAVACALVGMASSAAAAVIVRRRVTGVLRAVGLTRPQLARLFGAEVAIGAVIAATLGIIAGSGLGWLQVEVLLRGMLGMAVLYSHPWALALATGLAVVVAASVGGWLLGRRAGRTPIGAALQWE